MLTIRDLLVEVAVCCYYDKELSWGAKTSAYRQEITETLAMEQRPVLVELADDLGLDPATVLIVDHHGVYAGADRPTSLHQVFALLNLPPERWTRWFALVAANDQGYIPALIEMGATREEIVRVRTADRVAQGITPAEEAEGERAIAHAELLAGGRLMVVHLAHTHTATVTDRLHPVLGGPGYENLLVSCPGQVNFFGTGHFVYTLHEHFPGGWYGGALPDRGFWGHEVQLPDILATLIAHLEQEIYSSAVLG